MNRPLDRLLAEIVEVGERIDSSKSIDAFFRKLCKYRIDIHLYFQQSDRHFKSRILGVDSNGLLIDQLLPSEGNQLLMQGEPSSLLANIDGVCICVPDLGKTSLAKNASDKDLLHHCPLPASLLQIQRRDAYRVNIRKNEPITVELEYNGQVLSGQMLDLSATGCRCLIHFGDTSTPEPGDQFQLSFTLPDGTAIECNNEARHCVMVENAQSPGFFILGIHFLRLPGMFERQISLFVSRMQRDERQLNNQR